MCTHIIEENKKTVIFNLNFWTDRLGSEVIKLFFMHINLKSLTITNSFLLKMARHENFSANKYENANYCWHFHIY